MMLRTKLFKYFSALILVFGALSLWVGIGVIKEQVIQVAQSRVDLDLRSARSIYDRRLKDIQTALCATADRRFLVDACAGKTWTTPEVLDRLEGVRCAFEFDFLTLVSPDGLVAMRATPPYRKGDARRYVPVVARAILGEPAAGALVLTREELQREGAGLAERAFLTLEETPHARLTEKKAESRGLVMMAAAPVRQANQVLGVIYAGKLVSRATDLVDRIQGDNYDGRSYEGRKVGTTTIFLGDTRVATTVLQENGNRALGTRVSKEVADQVLDNGRPWVGRAFVVKDWFLTKYEPLKDPDGKVIGMLYVGILEAPFTDLQTSVTLRFCGLTLLALIATLVVTFFLAGVLTGPVRRLAEAARAMRGGAYPPAVPATGASRETTELTVAFNQMVAALKEREESLSEANADLKKVNRNYMATLGFVTHELKTPIASMMNYAYLLKSEKIGDLTEKQKKAVGVIDHTLRRITEMVRHYLNLSRIERDELNPAMTRFVVRTEVIDPLLDAIRPEAEARDMVVENGVGEEIALRADRNMTREVFENLVTNALKYGRDGGRIRISAEAAAKVEGTGAGRVAFSVWNEGEGIPADKLDSLFQRFTRLEGAASAQKQRGSGLGLFITKHIVKAHGGEIEARSKPGEWAEFRFTMPRAENA